MSAARSSLRFAVAWRLVVALERLARLAGHGGSSLPGLWGQRLDPRLLEELAGTLEKGSAVVTGTNGKTTTATLLAEIGRRSGLRLAHNAAGANLISGLVTALAGQRAEGADQFAVLEVDEATVARAMPALRPRLIVVTNFFRDQLDRYGELLGAVGRVAEGITAVPETALLLNADDPHVASLARPDREVHAFALEVAGGAARKPGGDAILCPRCGRPLRYRSVTFAHLGDYACPGCGFRRPSPEVVGQVLRNGRETALRIRAGGQELADLARFQLPGLYNAYNAVAAAAAAWLLGWPAQAISRALSEATPVFGRMERFEADGHPVRLALVKNPAGFDAVLETLAGEGEPGALVLAINDLDADGHDISWLWDVRFEDHLALLARSRPLLASGLRAEDMALRLAIAGADRERIELEPDPERALDGALRRLPRGRPVTVCLTYTALLDLHRRLARRYPVAAFWERGARRGA
ncbi:MAG: MurT ligase domain-containing protein [Bacillota bacterium]|nr:MurT ligase domain-containing protein [Bacillota bacterium]